jgi:hypothetical protein
MSDANEITELERAFVPPPVDIPAAIPH